MAFTQFVPEVLHILIGRNEGDRLIRAIGSLPPGAAAVYVDSGSTDGSAQAARVRGFHVLELDRSRPFSAARARNAGAAAAVIVAPEADLLQFMDGDCELNSDWLAAAQSALQAHPEVAVVCGHRRERNPGQSIYHRLMDLEWGKGVGKVESCGGDALFRRDDFERSGGFDEACSAGEEPELCARLRAAGREVLRINAEMTVHDSAMNSFPIWWQRQIRSGFGSVDSDRRQQIRSGTATFSRQRRSALFWGFVWPLMGCAGAGFIFLSHGFLCGVLPSLVIALGILQTIRITLRYYHRGLSFHDAWLAAALTLVSKLGQAIGIVQWYLNRMGRQASDPIEYKSPASTNLLTEPS